MAHFVVDGTYDFKKDVNGVVFNPFEDLCLKLIEAIGLKNWEAKKTVHTYELVEDSANLSFVEDGIPVGCLDFVEKYFWAKHKRCNFLAINIPEELMNPKYLKRKVLYLRKGEDVPPLSDPVFIKSSKNNKKGYSDIVNLNMLHHIPGQQPMPKGKGLSRRA